MGPSSQPGSLAFPVAGDRFLGAPQVFAQKVACGQLIKVPNHGINGGEDVRCHFHAGDRPGTPKLDSRLFAPPSCNLERSQCNVI